LTKYILETKQGYILD